MNVKFSNKYPHAAANLKSIHLAPHPCVAPLNRSFSDESLTKLRQIVFPRVFFLFARLEIRLRSPCLGVELVFHCLSFFPFNKTDSAQERKREKSMIKHQECWDQRAQSSTLVKNGRQCNHVTTRKRQGSCSMTTVLWDRSTGKIGQITLKKNIALKVETKFRKSHFDG